MIVTICDSFPSPSFTTCIMNDIELMINNHFDYDFLYMEKLQFWSRRDFELSIVSFCRDNMSCSWYCRFSLNFEIPKKCDANHHTPIILKSKKEGLQTAEQHLIVNEKEKLLISPPSLRQRRKFCWKICKFPSRFFYVWLSHNNKNTYDMKRIWSKHEWNNIFSKLNWKLTSQWLLIKKLHEKQFVHIEYST